MLTIILSVGIRKIIYIGDQRLRQPAATVKNFTPQLATLAQDMLETMRSSKGVGLAGPQIGVMQRIFVAEIPLPRDKETTPHPHAGQQFILTNPVIVAKSDTTVEGEEGCLSIPGLRGLIDRAEQVTVAAQTIEGHKVQLTVDNLLARIFQHEIDHLNGVLFTDHIIDQDKLWQVSAADNSDNDEATEQCSVIEPDG